MYPVSEAFLQAVQDHTGGTVPCGAFLFFKGLPAGDRNKSGYLYYKQEDGEGEAVYSGREEESDGGCLYGGV